MSIHHESSKGQLIDIAACRHLVDMKTSDIQGHTRSEDPLSGRPIFLILLLVEHFQARIHFRADYFPVFSLSLVGHF